MEALMKYVPFVDFLLKIDEKKYYKFTKIRKWILSKKPYSPVVIKKTEDAILMQYKNLLLENIVKIPQNITDTFAPSIDLCSDDEEGCSQNKKEGIDHIKKKQDFTTPDLDEDNDIEIVSIDYIKKSEEQCEEEPVEDIIICKEEYVIDEASKDILNKIDQIAADDKKLEKKLHEPVNYTFKMEYEQTDTAENDKENIFQRRTPSVCPLFKRRADFTADEVIVECLNDANKPLLSNDTQIETIALDSDSECEVCNDDEHPSTSNKKNNEGHNETNFAKPDIEILNTDSNSNGSYSAKNNEKIEMICNSIESILPEMSDLLNEVEEMDNVATRQQTEKTLVVEKNDKENTTEKNVCTTSNENLNLGPTQISKILEDISSKTDFEMETLYEALQFVNKMNTEQIEVTETPPAAPPPVQAYPAMAPPELPCYQQHESQVIQPIIACNASNLDFVPTVAPRPKPKLNINDPRIKKQLQAMKNSPILSYNLLNKDLEESIRKICHETVMQPSTLNLNQNNTAPIVSKTTTGTSKSAITYGEYKRRQLEKKKEMERKREEERKAKIEADRLEREKLDKLEKDKKKGENICSQLLTTLNPCSEATSLLNQQHSTKELQQAEHEQNKETNDAKQLNCSLKKQPTNAKASNSFTINKRNNKRTKRKNEQKLSRIYSELKCTVKGFDKIQDYITENDRERNTNSSSPIEESSRLIGLRRKSSMHALSAITEQLGEQSNVSDSDLSENSSKKRSKNSSHDSSSESLSQDYLKSKRRKTIDELTKPSQRIIIDDTSSSDDEMEASKNLKEVFVIKEPLIKLQRMSNEFIKKHSKRTRIDSTHTATGIVDQSVKLKKTCEIVESLQESNQKILKLKKYNNDCQMTERNTVFCILCRSKPLDLTNHYKGRHKVESYVSRLDWSELEDLAVNINFATLQPSTKNSRFERYEVECPFCKEKITDQFINLYNHYSVHTGEYAFQCSHCFLSKPFKPDIQSHILHSKTCRNSSIQIMYRYPPQTQCIYLHYCNICNFVQLNEANVLKHLREHHDRSKAVASNIQKCILAAISNGPDVGQTGSSTSPLLTADANNSVKQSETVDFTTTSQIDFKIDDDDIPVSNEPCLEEEYLDNMQQTPVNQPMTVIHNFVTNIQQSTNQMATPQPSGVEVEKSEMPLPIQIKYETLDKNTEAPKLTSNKCSPQKKQSFAGNMYAAYDKYRRCPPNLNYLGLFKCMIDDCYYSTDSIGEIITHLTEHSTDAQHPNQYLQCPYCTFTLDTPVTPSQLVNHVLSEHGHLKFQCSLCCYRSCDASNVDLHQKIRHNDVLSTCQIYKTTANSMINLNNKGNVNLNERIEKNIYKISCKICGHAGFYHTKLLIKHINNDHNISNANNLNIYSCINCTFTVDNKNQLRFHIAAKHPGERPLIYDHNAEISNIEEDSKSCSNVVDISEPVPYVEIKVGTTSSANTEESMSQDIKPDFNKLLLMNEETTKVRLRKLTSHTGVAPDNLYRCPEQSCGGFFSNVELWVRHMKVRHLALECQCPHCSTPMLLPVEQFADHFERHRRHTYICFYCSTTSPTESLARKHAAQMHSQFRQMRYEKISFNISYSYYIVIQRELFQEREKFIAEFSTVLDKRLNDLERNEVKSLKHQWPIRDNMPWYDDYLQNIPKRKVARRCLMKDCDYRTLKEENLYYHLSTSHTITGTQFNCSKCDYHVERCNNLDELFNHIKLHNECYFICAACSLIVASQPKITAHIADQHMARDVPVIHLFRTSHQLFHKIYIVFAEDNITFSTMKNCFCCSEKNMSGDVFNLHLKRYHNLSLTYYCEKCINFSFKSLLEVKPHFEQFHNSHKFKIRCELAARSDLQVLSIDDFQVEVMAPPHSTSQQIMSSISVKNEPLDAADNDNVVLIEEDDVIIENSLKAAQQKQAEVPKLKCASFSKLLQPNMNTAATSSKPQRKEIPRLKYADLSNLVDPSSIIMSARTPTVQQNHIIAPTISMPPTLPVNPGTSQGYYNLTPQQLNTNPLMINVNTLNRIPATPMPNNDAYLLFNKTIIRPIFPNSNSTLPPLNVNNQNSVNNNYRQSLPNSQYINQNSQNRFLLQANNLRLSTPTTSAPFLIMPQNYNNNNIFGE